MEHLSREQLEQYRDRTLPAQAVVSTSVHLGECEPCRNALAALTPAGAAVGLLADIGDVTSEHLTLEQLDGWVDDTLDGAERELVSAHIGLCDPCARELRIYEAAAPVMSEPVVHVRAAESVAHGAAVPPAAKPLRRGEPTFGERLRDFFQSPQLVIMTTLGIALAVGVPYMALRTLPDAGDSANVNTPKDVPVDTSSLEAIPPYIAGPVYEALAAEEPTLPDILGDLSPADGIAQIYPVMESVEVQQPALSWDPLELGPYSVSISDAEERVIARVQGLPNTAWIVPVPLEREKVYTWRVTAGNGMYEEASFLVLDEESVELMRNVRSQYGENHLVMGGIAQYLGLLTVAEREYGELLKQYPNSSQAARLLDNVLALRDMSQ